METASRERQMDSRPIPTLTAFHDVTSYEKERRWSSASTITLSERPVLPNFSIFYRSSVHSLDIGPWHEEHRLQPPHLFHISALTKTVGRKTSEDPQILLHSGRDETHPVICSMKHRASAASEIYIRSDEHNDFFLDNEKAETNELRVELRRRKAFTGDVHSFDFDIPSEDGTLVRERFEWRQSRDPEVQSLATDNIGTEKYNQDDRGLKLVNVRTGHLIAVFVRGKDSKVYNPREIAGKMRFISVEDWGEEFRMVVVMSIISITERGR